MTTHSPYSKNRFSGQEALVEETRLQEQAAVRWPQESALMRSVGLKEGSVIIDFGCGPGFITELLATEVGKDGKVIGVEKNKKLFDIAKIRNANHTNVSIIHSDVTHISELESACADFIYARFILQHTPNHKHIMEEARRLLKPGGRLLVLDVDDALFHITPYPDYISEFLNEAAQGQTSYGGDRYIGHKIAGFMHEAGYSEISPTVFTFTSKKISSDTFLDVTTKFKIELLNESRRTWGHSIINKLYEEATSGSFFGTAGIYFVCGTKL
jgi:ubiquinone/menaquinone biosynthesis C-methylase UbiE